MKTIKDLSKEQKVTLLKRIQLNEIDAGELNENTFCIESKDDIFTGIQIAVSAKRNHAKCPTFVYLNEDLERVAANQAKLLENRKKSHNE